MKLYAHFFAALRRFRLHVPSGFSSARLKFIEPVEKSKNRKTRENRKKIEPKEGGRNANGSSVDFYLGLCFSTSPPLSLAFSVARVRIFRVCFFIRDFFIMIVINIGFCVIATGESYRYRSSFLFLRCRVFLSGSHSLPAALCSSFWSWFGVHIMYYDLPQNDLQQEAK